MRPASKGFGLFHVEASDLLHLLQAAEARAAQPGRSRDLPSLSCLRLEQRLTGGHKLRELACVFMPR